MEYLDSAKVMLGSSACSPWALVDDGTRAVLVCTGCKGVCERRRAGHREGLTVRWAPLSGTG